LVPHPTPLSSLGHLAYMKNKKYTENRKEKDWGNQNEHKNVLKSIPKKRGIKQEDC
jgi:hypothetical protein